MFCIFGRMDEFKGRIFIILPPKVAKIIIHAIHTFYMKWCTSCEDLSNEYYYTIFIVIMISVRKLLNQNMQFTDFIT